MDMHVEGDDEESPKRKHMALGPASPPAQPPPQPPPRSFEGEIAQLRQQMFPVILTTYGIPPGSERARSLALLLGLSDRYPTPMYHMMGPPRIGYHPPPWPGRTSQDCMPLLRCYHPFSCIPDDVLSHILAYEAVPRALMCQWYNVSKQWRRCLLNPLCDYYDFLRITRSKQHGYGLPGIASTPVLIPRPYAVRVDIMRCMRCEKLCINEFTCDGTMWGHCLWCGMDGQFESCQTDLNDFLGRFPSFVKQRHQDLQGDGG